MTTSFDGPPFPAPNGHGHANGPGLNGHAPGARPPLHLDTSDLRHAGDRAGIDLHGIVPDGHAHQGPESAPADPPEPGREPLANICCDATKPPESELVDPEALAADARRWAAAHREPDTSLTGAGIAALAQTRQARRQAPRQQRREPPPQKPTKQGQEARQDGPQGPEPPPPEQQPFPLGQPLWMRDVQRTNTGKPIANLYNTMIGLREDLRLTGLFSYNEMTHAVTLLKPIPSRVLQSDVDNFKPRDIRDVDVSSLLEFLQAAGLRDLQSDTLHRAADLRASESPYHPIRDYLNALRWHGEKRVFGWTSSYLGADHTPYSSEIGTMALVGMVARIYEPGCKLDHCMVLIDPEQGTLKSSVCRVLAGDEWFSDSLPDIRRGGKDVQLHLRGKWIVEIADLAAIHNAEPELLKAFVSRQAELYRPPWGRRDVHEPRQNIFIGTTNVVDFLNDPTGGRRFWPVHTGKIDLRALARDRDQLLAEAVVLYREGRHWWPDLRFEADVIRPEQDAGFKADAWEDAIAPWLANQRRATVLEIASLALNLEKQRVGMAEQNRIRAVLRHLRWARGTRGPAGERYYYPPRGSDAY